MFCIKGKHLINRKLNINFRIIYFNKSSNNGKTLDELKSELRVGPQLSDFISDGISSEETSDRYKGKLKRQLGDNQRYLWLQ